MCNWFIQVCIIIICQLYSNYYLYTSENEKVLVMSVSLRLEYFSKSRMQISDTIKLLLMELS